MREFAGLYKALDETNRTTGKVQAMVEYFRAAPPSDAAWAVSFLVGRRPKRLVSGPKLWGWAVELSGLPPWLFAECYDAVGDVAEAITLVLPAEGVGSGHSSLTEWVETRLLPLAGMDEDAQRVAIQSAWRELDSDSRFVWNKLITGGFRVGVSQDLVVRALSQASGLSAPVVAHRLMGSWEPTAEFFQHLFRQESEDADVSKPYPFCLAHALPTGPEELGEFADWHMEWKWDGIRAQAIRRGGASFVWSRGEDLVTERFPEIRAICDALPEGTVLDGEILAWSQGKPLKFLELQKRIGRKNLSKKILEQVPVVLVAFDILEHDTEDVRELPLRERRKLLEAVVDRFNGSGSVHLSGEALVSNSRLAVDLSAHKHSGVFATESRLLLAAPVQSHSWQELAEARQTSRELNVEGIMLKRWDSPYVVGRKKGMWWKWKIEPYTVDCVLIYAQKGNGKRASLYTDYTFGVWDAEGKLVPFAKAYSGLTDEEIRRVDAFVRNNTLERFGPVRSVKPQLVFELAFEAMQLSSRHRSGVAVRFPRINRWRHDKQPGDADTLDGIRQILESDPGSES